MWLRIPSEFFPCSPVREASTSELESLSQRLASSAMWRATSRQPASWRRALKTEAWMTRQFGAMLDPSTAAIGAERWISSLAASHAQTFLSRASEPGSLKTHEAGSGFNTSASFARFSPEGSLLKTSPQSLLFPQEESYSEGLPKAGSMRNGYLFERPTLDFRTDASECSSWPTPNSKISESSQTHRSGARSEELLLTGMAETWPTPNTNRSSYSRSNFRPNIREVAVNWPTPDANTATYSNGHNGFMNIREAAANWTTPQAHDTAAGDASRVRRHGTKHGCANLTDDVAAWPTPNAHDGRRPGSDATSTQGANLKRDAELWMTPNTPNGGRHVSEAVVAAKGATENGKRTVGLESQARVFPTPSARDWKSEQGGAATMKHFDRPAGPSLSAMVTHGLSLPDPQTETDGPDSSPSVPGSRRRLNPAFVCSLMNWPWWWTQPEPISFAREEMELWLSAQRSRLRSLCGELD